MTYLSGEDVVELPQDHAAVGHHDDGIPGVEHGVAVGDLRGCSMADADHQHIGLQLDILERHPAEPGAFIDQKLHGLCLAVGNGVDGDGGTGLVLHGPDIADNVIAAQLLGAHIAAQGEVAHNAVVVRVAQLGDDLGDPLGDAVEGDDHVQLVQPRQSHQGIALGKALALQ